MSDSDWWFVDLAAVLALTGAAGGAVVTGLGGPLRLVLVSLLVVFLPGYAFVSAVYPRTSTGAALPTFDEGGRDSTDPPERYAVNGAERFALAVVASICISPTVAAVANFTPWGISARPVVIGLTLVVGVLVVVAAVTRLSVDPGERFVVSPGVVADTGGRLFLHDDRRRSGTGTTTMNLLLVVALLAVAASTGFAAMSSPATDSFTEFYLVTDDPGGGGVPPTYDANFSQGQSRTFTVGIENREGERTSYEVVVEVQRVDGSGMDAAVLERQQVTRFERTLADGETVTVDTEVTPQLSSGDVRVAYYLYEGTAPGTPSAESADLVLTLPIDVAGGGGEGDRRPPGALRDAGLMRAGSVR